MSILGSVRAFIDECPFLDEFRTAVNVNFLDEDEKSYMIEPSVTQPITKKYTDGSSVRQFNFIFASREYFGRDVLENIDIDTFYEHFSEWLEECSKEKKLPVMEDGKQARKIKATTNGYLYNADETKAQYQIQCQLIYYQR